MIELGPLGGYGMVNLNTGERIIFSPPWLSQPYADRASCWGCGLEPEGDEVTVYEDVWTEGVGRQTLPHRINARLCRWCAELKQEIYR